MTGTAFGSRREPLADFGVEIWYSLNPRLEKAPEAVPSRGKNGSPMDERSLKKTPDPLPGGSASAVPSASAALEGSVGGIRASGAEIVSLDPARKARALKGPRRGNAGAPPKVQIEAHIGWQLKTLYNDVLTQPIPDRFLDLLQTLDARAARPKGDGGK